MDLLLVLLAFFATASCQIPYYQSKYDSLDIEEILNHKRLVQHYAACLLNRGPCPPQGADLKRVLPEALETTCMRCTEKQKIIILKTINRLRTEYPTLWKELVDMWDPTEERVRKFESAIDKTGEDGTNFIGNRFGEMDTGNDVAGAVKPEDKPYPPATTTRLYLPPATTQRPPSTYLPPATSKTTQSPPSTYLPPATSKTTQSPPSTAAPTTTRKPTTTTGGSTTIFYGWRQQPPTTRPVGIPFLKFDAGLLDLGSRFLQAGTEVAEMVINKLSQVQKAFSVQVN